MAFFFRNIPDQYEYTSYIIDRSCMLEENLPIENPGLTRTEELVARLLIVDFVRV